MEEEKKEEVVPTTQETQTTEQTPTEEAKEEKKGILNNTKQVKGKSLRIWLIVMIVIFMLFTFGLGLYLGKELYGKEETKKSTNKPVEQPEVEQPENVKKEVTDASAKTRLEDFVKAASYDDLIGNGFAREFMTGKDSIDTKMRASIAWNSLVMIKKIPQVKVDPVPDKYKDDIHFLSDMKEISITSYTNEYKRLFNDDPNYDLIGDYSFGCPGPYKVDQELGKIYIGVECGGTGNPEYYYKIFKYEEDNKNYYVYEYVGTKNPSTEKLVKVKSNEEVNVTSFEGNEDKFETVVWTFDKNFNFISSENIG